MKNEYASPEAELLEVKIEKDLLQATGQFPGDEPYD